MSDTVVVDANLALKWVLLEEDSHTSMRLWNAVKRELNWVRWLGEYQPELH
jgi:hypothetical protein